MIRHGLCGGEKNEEGVLIPLIRDQGIYLWNPASAAADTVVEELDIVQHKWMLSTHIFIS